MIELTSKKIHAANDIEPKMPESASLTVKVDIAGFMIRVPTGNSAIVSPSIHINPVTDSRSSIVVFCLVCIVLERVIVNCADRERV